MVLERADEHDGALLARDVIFEVVAVLEHGRDPEPQDPDQLVDRGGRARAAEDHGVLVVAAERVADDPPRLLAEARGLKARPGALRVRVRVRREHLLAQELLDEREGSPAGRIVGVGHAPEAVRGRHRKVVADDRRADEIDERRARERIVHGHALRL